MIRFLAMQSTYQTIEYALYEETTAVEQVSRKEGYSLLDGKDFLDTFAKSANINLHVEVYSGEDVHHVLEAVFKAFGTAMDEATQIDVRRKGVPSTKGTID